MKKIMLIIMCIFAITASAQTKKSVVYGKQSVKGMWLTTQAYNEQTKEWKDLEPSEMFAFGFTTTKTNGKDIAIMTSTESGNTHFTYKVVNNTIQLYDIISGNTKLISIKILSLKRGKEMIGKLSTTSSIYAAKFRFMYIDEGEE